MGYVGKMADERADFERRAYKPVRQLTKENKHPRLKLDHQFGFGLQVKLPEAAHESKNSRKKVKEYILLKERLASQDTIRDILP